MDSRPLRQATSPPLRRLPRRTFQRSILHFGLAGLAVWCVGCASAPGPERPPLALSEPSGWRYALVIDASSSASTLQIFEWQPAREGRLPRAVPAPRPADGAAEEPWEMRVKPGLGSYAGRPDEAAAALEPLIEYALGKIGDDPAVLAETSLYLRATAGLRVLAADEREQILASVDEYLASTPFGATSSRVISGVEEGLFGWITVNYVLGHLDHGGPFPTVGALDLGGASTQITFQPLDYPRRNAHEVSLGTNTYRLYTISYLGLGQDEARQTVADPACYLVGYSTPWGYGTGDFDGCRAAIRAALAAPCSEEERPCSLFGAYQPPLYGDFLALSAYAYITRFLGLEERLRPQELEAAGREFCARDWRAWITEEPEIANDAYLPTYCYGAAHVVTLLTDGFGFPADTDRISAPLRVQGSAIGWTLGALLSELAGGGKPN